MKQKTNISHFVPLDAQGRAKDGDILYAMTQRQANAAAITAQANDPRIKAKNVLDEIVKVAASCSVTATILCDETKKITQAADSAKVSVFAVSDKMSTAMKRLWETADFEKLEKMTLLVERMTAAMTTLAELEKNGRLQAVCKAIQQ